MKIVLTQIEIEQAILEFLENNFDIDPEVFESTPTMAVTRGEDGITVDVAIRRYTEEEQVSNFTAKQSKTFELHRVVCESLCGAARSDLPTNGEPEVAQEEATSKAEPDPEPTPAKAKQGTGNKKTNAKAPVEKKVQPDPEPQVAVKEERDLMQETLDECAAEEEAERAAEADEKAGATNDEDDDAPFDVNNVTADVEEVAETTDEPVTNKPRGKILFGKKPETDGAETAQESDPEPKQAPRKSLFSNLQKP